MKKVVAALSLLVCCMPLASLAHPGHGETGGFTITHYFTEPAHVFFSLGVLATVSAIVLYIRHLTRNRQTN